MHRMTQDFLHSDPGLPLKSHSGSEGSVGIIGKTFYKGALVKPPEALVVSAGW